VYFYGSGCTQGLLNLDFIIAFRASHSDLGGEKRLSASPRGQGVTLRVAWDGQLIVQAVTRIPMRFDRSPESHVRHHILEFSIQCCTSKRPQASGVNVFLSLIEHRGPLKFMVGVNRGTEKSQPEARDLSCCAQHSTALPWPCMARRGNDIHYDLPSFL
jgi:hypothetical protein